MTGGMVGYFETGKLHRLYVTPQAEVVVRKVPHPLSSAITSGKDVGGVAGTIDYLGDHPVSSYLR